MVRMGNGSYYLPGEYQQRAAGTTTAGKLHILGMTLDGIKGVSPSPWPVNHWAALLRA